MLVRHSLLLRKRPAVIVLSAANVRPGKELTLFYHIPENDKTVLAQYYGVPLLSLRGATYHHTQVQLTLLACRCAIAKGNCRACASFMFAPRLCNSGCTGMQLRTVETLLDIIALMFNRVNLNL